MSTSSNVSRDDMFTSNAVSTGYTTSRISSLSKKEWGRRSGKTEWSILKSRMKEATTGVVTDLNTIFPDNSGENNIIEQRQVRAKVVRKSRIDGINTNLKFGDFQVRETQSKDSLPEYIIFHNGTLKQLWDIMILFLVVYIAIVIPWFLSSFTVESQQIRAVNIAIDFCFMIDILVAFFTTFENPFGEVVFLHKDIRQHHLHNRWFLLDVFACLPYTLISKYTGGRQDTGGGSLYSYLKLLRLLRVVLAPNLPPHSKQIPPTFPDDVTIYLTTPPHPSTMHAREN
jgi:hypothetical protein